MYDRQTESWWQQFTGKGIVGHYAGAALRRVPSEIVSFADFMAAHPTGLVLSRETGSARPYGRNPYAGYDNIDQSPFLFTGKKDDRLPPMERALSVSAGAKHRLYPLTLLERHAVLNRELAGLPYVVFSKGGMASPLDAERIEAGRRIPAKGKRLPAVDSGVHFAFAWLAFNPDSEIVRSLP